MPSKKPIEGTICDHCSAEVAVIDAETCADCGLTLCHKHVGALDHDCEDANAE